jgi:hypothetical protein
MKFYFLIQKEEVGCPVGSNGLVLLKDFSEESRGHYGLFPWYAGPKRFGGKLSSFPNDLILMMDDPDRCYDLTRGSPYFYVMSSKVRDVLSEFKTSFVDVSPVRCVNVFGEEVCSRNYFVGSTKRIGVADVCNPILTRRGGKYGASILNIEFKDDFDLDLFDLYDTSGVEFSLVASERLMLALVVAGIKGVDFCPVDGFKLKTSDESRVLKQRYLPV